MPQRLSAFPAPADKGIAIALAAGLVLVLAIVLYASWGQPVPVALRIVFGALAALAIWFVGTLPFSYNDLSDQGLTLQQGLYFRAWVPYANIESVDVIPPPGGIWSPGVRREEDGKGLRVVLSNQNLIQLKLKQLRFRVPNALDPSRER